jgi:ABC-type transport system involved in cytochrome c biogenesis permease component
MTKLFWNIFLAVVFAVVLFFQRNSVVEGTNQSLASVVLPSILGMTVAWGGLSGAAGILAIEREDGTLLRAKAIPHGMVGYVVAKVVMTAVTSAVTVIIILVAGLLFVPELVSTPWTGWLMMVGILVLGLLATMPWGAIIGSVVKSPQGAFGLTFLPMSILTAISGSFTRLQRSPVGSSRSLSYFRSTGSATGCALPYCRKPSPQRSAVRGATSRCSVCSARGLWRACCSRRLSCAEWLAVSPGRQSRNVAKRP